MGAGGQGGAAPGCLLGITPISPTSFDAVEAGPGVTMRVQGSSYGVYVGLTWSWTVTFSDGTQIPTTPIDATGAPQGTMVSFPVAAVGSYQIVARVSGDARCTMATQVFTAVAPMGTSFTFRTTAAGFPVQETRVNLASSSPAPQMVELSAGQSFNVEPVDPLYRLLLASYVRISSPGTSFELEGDTTHTPFLATLLPYMTYDVLVVPDDDYAPLLVSSRPMTWSSMTFITDPGISVLAQTLASDGTPVANVRMLLRQGTVPSTLGTSDASGAITLLAREGSMSATIVPPDGSGLPVATIPDGSFDISASGLPSLTMQWDPLPQATLTVDVRGPDGVTPIGKAQVRLVSTSSYRAGVLNVSGDAMLDAAASVAANATTGDDGRATFPPFPASDYAVTIIPASSAAPAAVTTVKMTLQPGAAVQTVTLATKVPLKGALLPLPASAGAVIQAIDRGTTATTTDPGTQTTGAVFLAQAGSDGTFSVSVDPKRNYELIVQPATSVAGALGRAVLVNVTPEKGAGTITLPVGQPFQGLVLSANSPSAASNNLPVPGAFIQVFCAAPPASCIDPAVSLAETTTLADGSFALLLPQSAATTSIAAALTGR